MLKFIIDKFANKRGVNDADVDFEVSGLKITLPSGHDLPTFQKDFPLYDALLGHIAKFLPDRHLVIDVGANVGDTVAAMSQSNPLLSYLCIEADDYFFEYLEKNVSLIKTNCRDVHIQTHKTLVGVDVQASSLSGGSRTKTVVTTDNSDVAIPTTKVDSIYADLANETPLALLKVDVDGYDYDVINSAIETLRNSNSYIYFECDLQSSDGLKHYGKTLNKLHELGYTYFSVFDNFGYPMTLTQSVDVVSKLIEYAYIQKMRSSHKTIYYLDILCFRHNLMDSYEEMMKSYIRLVEVSCNTSRS